MEEFVGTSTRQYNLDLVRYALPMRRALEAYLSDRPSVRAIFMGTRRTDPHSEFLEHFSPTDADWPQFMRINPLIDWHYAEIWTVRFQLPPPPTPPPSFPASRTALPGGGGGKVKTLRYEERNTDKTTHSSSVT